jgi:hypothetical protein
MRSRSLAAFIGVFSVTCCVVALDAGVAFACEPSYWYAEADPTLSCLRTKDVTDGVELRNGCGEPIEIAPEGCDEPCSETVRIAVAGSRRLELPGIADNPSEDVEQVFTYKQADQTGTITIGYSSNPCSNDTGDCSAAPTAGRRIPPLGTWLALIAPAALVALRCRARSARCSKHAGAPVAPR